jgi:predicted cupin superfamily sugar epimerase
MNPPVALTADDMIRCLRLQPLPIEGGFFHEIYRAAAPAATAAPRCCATIIYYLLRAGQRSRFHRVAADETWLFLAGAPARQLTITPDGACHELLLGDDLAAGQQRHHVMPAQTWQTTLLTDAGADAWALFACIVAPGFEYADFAEASDEEICAAFPQLAARVRAWLAQA